jgi:hypothetical protein
MRDGAGHAYGHDHQMRLCCVPGGRDPILASRRASSAPARWCPRQSSISCITDFPAGDRPRAKSPYGPRRRNSQAARCTASTSVTSCKSTSYAAVLDRDRGSLICPGRPVSPHARRFLRMTAGSGPWLFLQEERVTLTERPVLNTRTGQSRIILFSFTGGPRVRIPVPPAESQQRTGAHMRRG